MTRTADKVKAQPATTLPKFPWAVEVLGPKRRIVDADGNDIALLGDAYNAGDRDTAEFIVRVANRASQFPLVEQYSPSKRDELCLRCAHAYYRHFDWAEDYAPIGCKYCACKSAVLRSE